MKTQRIYKFQILLQFDFVSSSKCNKGKYHCSFFIFRKDDENDKSIVLAAFFRRSRSKKKATPHYFARTVAESAKTTGFYLFIKQQYIANKT